jgi:hypothetical protein
MDPKWYPTLVTALIAAAGWLINYGTFQQKLKDVAKDTADNKTDLDSHKKEIWPIVRATESDVARIEGRLDRGKGKGAHA